MNDGQLAKAPEPILHFPTVLGAVVITYNVSGLNSPLKLTGATIADIYLGKISKWNGEQPAEVNGQFTLKGITKPLKLTIKSFLCKPSPVTHQDVCGADAEAHFNRDEWGLDIGKSIGFKMDTKLLISIEASAEQ